MTRTRFTLDDLGGALTWRALLHFVLNLPRDSALSRELRPREEVEAWSDGTVVAPLLADIYDAISWLTYDTVKVAGARPRKPRPYPRPWAKRAVERHVGSDPIPVTEFDAWWERGG